MQKAPHILIALFDANPEQAHFMSPILSGRAALNSAKLGIIARLGSPVVAAVLESLSQTDTTSIALSPASSAVEHKNAYRLPFVSMPLIFTGKGATGADMIALESAQAVIIFGTYPNVLENILEAAKERAVPIGMISDEDPTDLHERVRALHPHMMSQLFVSYDPAVLVREIAEELRRRRLEEKNQ